LLQVIGGKGLYQIRVDLGEFAYNCTCPSRKLPCKHVLGHQGLLVLAVRDLELSQESGR
jgi:uncharacterized Zn finger protein